MSCPATVAVLDIGKTNVKVAVVDRLARQEIDQRSQPNVVRAVGPYPHYDVEGMWAFFGRALRELSAAHRIDGIAVTAHGASIVVMGEDGLALPVLDYEFNGPDACWDAYNAARPDFSETHSPRLPKGLTPGAQLFWQEATFPKDFAEARWIVTYPQYWTWRLTGTIVNEITSVGCHSDLWNQNDRTWSSLVRSRGWLEKMAPIQSATQPQGILRTELARDWGLPKNLPVAGGLHDSNASIVPHLLAREQPFSVISTGTWAITFGVGAQPAALDEARDTLSNVNVFAEPVPCARFMGGREFEMLTGGAGSEPSDDDLALTLARRLMVSPAVVTESGPYRGLTSDWDRELTGATTVERYCAASLYLLMMAARSLALIEARGPTIIEGPFARNPIVCRGLATLSGRTVLSAAKASTGTSIGAALLFEIQNPDTSRGTLEYAEYPPYGSAPASSMKNYADAWNAAAERRWRDHLAAAAKRS